jgi:Concanavalin A-like lectin/glucanases superfamily/Secretion system C-terminal sorting domain
MNKKYFFSIIVLFFFAVALLAQQTDVDPSTMLGYWKLNEADGTTAVDESTYSHDLTLMEGANFIAGHSDNAMDVPYGGWAEITDAELDLTFPCASLGAPTEKMSVMAWVKLASTASRQAVIVKEAENQRGFVFSVTDGFVTFQVHNLNQEKLIVLCDSAELDTDTWYHIAATYEYVADWTSVIKLYLNGNLIHVDNAVPGPINMSNARLVLGAYLYHPEGTYSNYTTGVIDEAAVFTSVLTQAHIADMMTSGVTVGTELKDEISLSYKIYPNPASSGTNIGFTLPAASQVELTVYDMDGRLITSLHDGDLGQGEHTIFFDTNALAAGVYVTKLKIGERSIQKRMVLTK